MASFFMTSFSCLPDKNRGKVCKNESLNKSNQNFDTINKYSKNN